MAGSSANLVRSTPGTTLTSLGGGRYDVTFPSSVTGCAYLASVGDPGNALVYGPAGVYTASVSNPDAVTYDMWVGARHMSTSLTTIALEEDGGQTRLTYTEQGVHFDGLDTVEGREEGTRGLLDQLGSYLASGR